LDGRAPFGHIEVVGFVHDAEDDTGFGGVALGDVGPEVAELDMSTVRSSERHKIRKWVK
jgi:hypothetical protein